MVDFMFGDKKSSGYTAFTATATANGLNGHVNDEFKTNNFNDHYHYPNGINGVAKKVNGISSYGNGNGVVV